MSPVAQPSPKNDINLAITDPPSNSTVATAIAVYGSCDAIGSGVAVSITVKITVVTNSNVEYSFSKQAAINLAKKTWEAFFDSLPTSKSSGTTIEVTCNCGGQSPTTATNTGITVVSTGTTTVQINSPYNNQSFNSLTPSPSLTGPPSTTPAPPMIQGTRGSNHMPNFYVTLDGDRLPSASSPAPAPDDSGPQTDTHNVSTNLSDVLPANPVAGTYMLHSEITVNNSSTVYRRAIGYIVYDKGS